MDSTFDHSVLVDRSGSQSATQFVLDEIRDRRLYLAGKRLVDILFASILLVLLAPLMAAIAIAVAVHSPGGAIFVQPRLGAVRCRIDGRDVWVLKSFPFYKFRTMVVNADQGMHEQCTREFVAGNDQVFRNNGASFKLKNDPRIHTLGRFLRKASFDELPQLFNVLKGDMSLVGPRPSPLYEAALYQPWHFQRLLTLPGITGLWQVRGRCRVPFREMVQMDIEYVRESSIWLDLKILLLTIPAVLTGRGAE